MKKRKKKKTISVVDRWSILNRFVTKKWGILIVFSPDQSWAWTQSRVVSMLTKKKKCKENAIYLIALIPTSEAISMSVNRHVRVSVCVCMHVALGIHVFPFFFFGLAYSLSLLFLKNSWQWNPRLLGYFSKIHQGTACQLTAVSQAVIYIPICLWFTEKYFCMLDPGEWVSVVLIRG